MTTFTLSLGTLVLLVLIAFILGAITPLALLLHFLWRVKIK